MTDAQILSLRERNTARMESAKKVLGNKWLLHPDNYVKSKKDSGILKLVTQKKLVAV